jgi:hypothetical protein
VLDARSRREAELAPIAEWSTPEIHARPPPSEHERNVPPTPEGFIFICDQDGKITPLPVVWVSNRR